jgi:arabinan endo-1,5-alpha-L-arabinosidase
MNICPRSTAPRPARASALVGGALAWMAFATALTPAWAAEWELSGALIVHDPSIVRADDGWWVFSTGAGIHVKHSSDGLRWAQGEQLFKAEPQWWRTYAPAMGKLDVWAPDVHLFRGRYWCYYSVSEFATNHSAIGLLSCTSPGKGDWRDDGFVISSVDAVGAHAASDPERRTGPSGLRWSNTIDPNLAADASGNPWLVFGSWFDGIHVVQLDPGTMKPAGPINSIAYRPHGIEAPNIVYRDGYYYLFVSIDKCCQGAKSTYKVTYGRSRSITGPFVDRDSHPMLEGGGSLLLEGGPRWKGPGGQTVYQDGESWLIVYHSYDAENKGIPVLKISDLYWDGGDWPTITKPAS